jgi:hypothetical protein
VQPFPIFALKISGREEKATVLALLAPPPMVIDAQFMYISRLPISLNQVHANNAGPEGASVGMLKFQVGVNGHPPMKEWMTLKVFPES